MTKCKGIALVIALWIVVLAGPYAAIYGAAAIYTSWPNEPTCPAYWNNCHKITHYCTKDGVGVACP